MKKSIPWAVLYTVVALVFLLTVHYGSRAVTVISQSMPVSRNHNIILDAGHGGIDGGTSSVTGKLESTYNLEITLCLKDLLAFLGYETTLVRDSDISVYTKGETIAQKKVSDLKQRLRITEETENALLLSIHQNYFSDSKYSGAQVFYANTPGSSALAERMQKLLVSALNPGSKRMSKQAKGIWLMEQLHCPGVLIECGFLSNPREEAKLRDPDYQKKLCCVIACAAGEYLRGA